MLPFTLPALPVSVSGRPDSARGAPGERGTPREVQRLPLGALGAWRWSIFWHKQSEVKNPQSGLVQNLQFCLLHI